MGLKNTGKRCSVCSEPIQQNEKTITDGKDVSHDHGQDPNRWRLVRNA